MVLKSVGQILARSTVHLSWVLAAQPAAQVHDLRWSRDPGRCRHIDICIGFLEAVFHQKVEIIPLIEHLAFDIWMVLTQEPHFPVLLCDQLLAHRGDLYIDIVLGEVEVWPEVSGRIALVVPFESEGMWLVLPVDSIEIQQSRKFLFAVVGELGEIGR